MSTFLEVNVIKSLYFSIDRWYGLSMILGSEGFLDRSQLQGRDAIHGFICIRMVIKITDLIKQP